MAKTGPKITASNDKITIAVDEKVRLGPLHTLVEGYLKLSRNRQRDIDDLIETFLMSGDSQVEKTPTPSFSPSDVVSLSDIDNQKKRVLHIVHTLAPLSLTAREVHEVYVRRISTDGIKISDVQTYLGRLEKSGEIEVLDDVSPKKYRIISQKTRHLPKVLL